MILLLQNAKVRNDNGIFDFDKRKELVAEELDQIMSWATYMPVYQRKELWIYNPDTVNTDTIPENTSKTKYVKILADELNIHKTPDFEASSVCGIVCKGDVYTIAETVTVPNCSTKMYKLKSGVYITASPTYVDVIEK